MAETKKKKWKKISCDCCNKVLSLQELRQAKCSQCKKVISYLTKHPDGTKVTPAQREEMIEKLTDGGFTETHKEKDNFLEEFEKAFKKVKETVLAKNPGFAMLYGTGDSLKTVMSAGLPLGNMAVLYGQSPGGKSMVKFQLHLYHHVGNKKLCHAERGNSGETCCLGKGHEGNHASCTLGDFNGPRELDGNEKVVEQLGIPAKKSFYTQLVHDELMIIDSFSDLLPSSKKSSGPLPCDASPVALTDNPHVKCSLSKGHAGKHVWSVTGHWESSESNMQSVSMGAKVSSGPNPAGEMPLMEASGVPHKDLKLKFFDSVIGFDWSETEAKKAITFTILKGRASAPKTHTPPAYFERFVQLDEELEAQAAPEPTAEVPPLMVGVPTGEVELGAHGPCELVAYTEADVQATMKVYEAQQEKKPLTAEERLQQVGEAYEWFLEHSETFAGLLGRDIAYLLGAIAKGTKVELYNTDPLIDLMKGRKDFAGTEKLPLTHWLWNYIDIIDHESDEPLDPSTA